MAVVTVSQNGWPADPDPAVVGIVPLTVDGVTIGDGVRGGDVAFVLGHLLGRFHELVEPLMDGWCWGFKYRVIAGSTVVSNHASGTAVDVNAPMHPQGRRGSFTPAQAAIVRELVASYGGAVRWGGDYTPPAVVDEMHFEINTDPATLAAVAARLGAPMTRTMYDSITATDIPLSAEIVGGYVSGPYAWSAADWARFAGKPQVRIATQAAHNVGNCLDVERGDATPDQAPGWVLRRRAAGVDPTVYCNELNSWPAVRAAFHAQGVPEPHYWVSRYSMALTGKIPDGAVGRQYADPKVHGGGHYDLSTVANYWPGVDPEVDMPLSQDDLDKIADTVKFKVLAGDWRPVDGRNPIDMLVQTVNTGFDLAARPAVALDDAAIAALAAALASPMAAELVKLGVSGVTGEAVAQAFDAAAASLHGKAL